MLNRKENPASKLSELLKSRIVLTQDDHDLHRFYADCIDLTGYNLDHILIWAGQATRFAAQTVKDTEQSLYFMEVLEFISRVALTFATHHELLVRQTTRFEELLNQYYLASKKGSEVGNG